jgi:environmental stress-induced protein Ves
MILRRAADHRRMPWVNGRGVTVEMLKEDGLRLSVAAVAEDGPFSLFPGIDRVLTVISGPGFRLAGAVTRDCRPLVPVTFPGDVAVSAAGVTAPSEDFNVMTARGGPSATVAKACDMAAGGRVFLLALSEGQANGRAVAPRDLVELRDEPLVLRGLTGLTVRMQDHAPRP